MRPPNPPLACDRGQHWQLRRAAIFAAGRLPYHLALEEILPSVMAERSPLITDTTPSLTCHSHASFILSYDAPGLLPFFRQGKARFVGLVGEILDEWFAPLILSHAPPSGAQTAEWLFERLRHHGWPSTPATPDLILDELHVPILQSAVLRAFRLCRRPDLIEEQLHLPRFVEWQEIDPCSCERHVECLLAR